MATLDQKLDQLLSKQENFQKTLRYLFSNAATKNDLANLKEKLVEKISHLPTKEQFYKKMDKWMKATTSHDLEKSAHKRAHERLNDHLAHSHSL